MLFEENIFEVDVGYVNICKYVNIVKVTRTASQNKILKISTTIFIDQNGIIEYLQPTTLDSKGTNKFIVPYLQQMA